MLITFMAGSERRAGETWLIPDQWLSISEPVVELVHLVTRPPRDIRSASCALRVDGASIELDYPENEANRIAGIVGGLRIRFSDSDHASVTSVEWKDNGPGAYQPCSVMIERWSGPEDANPGSSAARLPELMEHLRAERVVERSAAGRARLEASVPLVCEACGLDFVRRYGPLGSKLAEIHVVGSATSPSPSRKQLAILCGSCHRMVHETCNWTMPIQEFVLRYLREPLI